VQRHAYADGEVLLAHDVGEPGDQCRVAEGGQAERLGPPGEQPGQLGRAGVRRAGVPRIRGHRDRDAQPGTGGQVLEAVVPLGHPRRGVGTHQIEMGDVPLPHHVLGAEQAVVLVFGEADHGVEEQAGLLLQRHPAQQVVDDIH
jgi:hypothetical protein